MTVTVTRKFEFDYAHRVLGHEGKCRHLHGHRGVAEVTVTAPALDSLGRVIDFSRLKELVGQWIDDNWDHNILLNMNDPLVKLTINDDDNLGKVFSGKCPYMTYGNPTAENMAKGLYDAAKRVLKGTGMEVVEVVIWETPNCKATYRPRPDNSQGG